MSDTNHEYGVEMNENNQVFCCEVKVFQASYLPQQQLSEEEYAILYNAGLANARSRFKENLPFNTEADISRSLKEIVGTLLKARRGVGRRRNLWFSTDPNEALLSAIVGENFKIDSSLSNVAGSPHTTDTIVVMKSKLFRNLSTVRQNRQQLVSAIVHILNDDVRRMFMFGITIEGHRMTLWYFSRSHSVKSQSFNFVEHPEILVEVLIPLVFADDQDVGLDPNIALKSNTECQYIYTVNGEAGPRRFRTTHSIFENRALTVEGRMTRVFRVVELDGQTDSPKEGAKPMVLKDVWLDMDTKTEMEIQQELFADIQQFAENPDWREHACLSGFNQDQHAETVEAFGELLKGERYKDLFLVIQAGTTGECSKQLVRSAWRATKSFVTIDTQRLLEPQSCVTHDLQIRRADEVTQPAYQKYGSKRRSFLVFDDECTRLHCLPTVGDVFTVLRDCVTALRLMFCAGWVHRDISCNNVMAVRDSETQRWKLKLADLEYSKKYRLNSGTASDPKTGTPFFMPCEILRRQYFGLASLDPDEDSTQLTFDLTCDDLTSNDPSDDFDEPLLHNFLHDLEATFWTGLWIITSRVNHERSRTYALNIFQDTPTLTLPLSRLSAFELPIQKALYRCLLEQLKRLATIFEMLRTSLYTVATRLGQARAWRTDDGQQRYAKLHTRFAVAFAALADPQAPWASVQLQLPTSSSPRPMDAIIDSDPKEPRVAPGSEAEEKEKAEEEEGLPLSVKHREPDEEERAPADAPPASSRKRSHHHGKEADGDDGEGRSSDSKRAKANDGGRISAAGPSGSSTKAGRYTLRSTKARCSLSRK